MACPVCRDKRMVEIKLTLKGQPVTMHSCSHCETRWWDSDGRLVPLENLFALAAPQR